MYKIDILRFNLSKQLLWYKVDEAKYVISNGAIVVIQCNLLIDRLIGLRAAVVSQPMYLFYSVAGFFLWFFFCSIYLYTNFYGKISGKNFLV